MKRFCALLTLVLFAGLSAFAQDSPAQITYMTEDYPPDNFVRNGTLTGYSVDLLKALWKKMGCPEQPIQVLPWARGYHNALEMPNHMLFTMARTPEREKLFHWVGPIYRTQIALIGLADRGLTLTKLGDAQAYVTAVTTKAAASAKSRAAADHR